ncbi:PA3496 family putative envelope integrity protein [Phytohalomonas tamaricis]|uniref:PA3496 family putative envelope integrity protein n=1 Tax=Phytohalomonas tamaricis TaxID=2081032 RepID=UPI000D0ACF14|nr:hypothetical protein [Phytohalomonas tamaricis]
MRNSQRLNSLKTQILDIAMTIEAEAFERQKKTAATRYSRARRGIEQHIESKRLASYLDENPPSIPVIGSH